jgi:hypothetical protein
VGAPHPGSRDPSALLRARSFASASAVYLISYTAFSGVMFYVILLYGMSTAGHRCGPACPGFS